MHSGKAAVEITRNQVRNAVKPTNQVKQRKEEEQGRKSFYTWKSEASEDNMLEEEGKIQTTCISNLAIIAMDSSLMKPDMGDPGIRAVPWVITISQVTSLMIIPAQDSQVPSYGEK